MDVNVTRPCPVDLDARGVDRSGLTFFCDHCERDVHVLSNMSRGAAQDFLAAKRGQKLCVSYRRARDGRILYADDPAVVEAEVDEDTDADDDDAPAAIAPAPLVPLSRLRRIGGLPRAAGVSLLLAACAPHEAPTPERADDPIVVLQRAPAARPTVAAANTEESVPVEGEAMIDDTPCDKPADPAAAGSPPTPEAVAAGPKRPMKKPKVKRPDYDVVDGGIF